MGRWIQVGVNSGCSAQKGGYGQGTLSSGCRDGLRLLWMWEQWGMGIRDWYQGTRAGDRHMSGEGRG